MSSIHPVSVYSLDDVSSDTSFIHFKIDKIPSYVLSVLKDILSSNVSIKIHILPWSPVWFIKDFNVSVTFTFLCSQLGWRKLALDLGWRKPVQWTVVNCGRAISIAVRIYLRPKYLAMLPICIADSTYLLKAVQAFRLKGFPIYAISIQVSARTSHHNDFLTL